MSIKKKKETPIYKRKLFIFVGVFVLIGFGLSVYNLMFKGSSSVKTVKIAPSTPVASRISTESGTEKASEVYNESISKYNKEKAKEATDKGETYVSPVTNEEKSESMADKSPINLTTNGKELNDPRKTIVKKEIFVDETKIRELQVQLEMLKTQYETEKEKTNQLFIKDEQERRKSIEENNFKSVDEKAKKIDAVFNKYVNNLRKTVPAEVGFLVYAESDAQKEAKQKEIDEQSKKEEKSNTVIAEKAPFKIGDLFYAKNKIAINTDYSDSNVVVAEVISTKRELHEARLFGGFNMKADSLVLNFNNIVLKDGREFSIEAYAIDEQLYLTSVRSDYDNHYFERFGLLFAGSFISGMAKAVTTKSNQGSTVVYDSQGNPVGSSTGSGYDLTAKDETIIAAAEVFDQASGIIKKGFDRPPTVELDYGQTFGVVVMSISGNN